MYYTICPASQDSYLSFETKMSGFGDSMLKCETETRVFIKGRNYSWSLLQERRRVNLAMMFSKPDKPDPIVIYFR